MTLARPVKNSERINVHLSKDDHEQLKALADRKRTTVSAYVRDLIVEEIEKQEGSDKKAQVDSD